MKDGGKGTGSKRLARPDQDVKVWLRGWKAATSSENQWTHNGLSEFWLAELYLF